MKLGTRGDKVVLLVSCAVLIGALSIPSIGPSTMTRSRADVQAQDFRVERPGCWAFVHLEAPGLTIKSAVVDSDAVNCEIYVEFEFEVHANAINFGNSWSACGSARGDGAVSPINGHGMASESAMGCPTDGS